MLLCFTHSVYVYSLVLWLMWRSLTHPTLHWLDPTRTYEQTYRNIEVNADCLVFVYAPVYVCSRASDEADDVIIRRCTRMCVRLRAYYTHCVPLYRLYIHVFDMNHVSIKVYLLSHNLLDIYNIYWTNIIVRSYAYTCIRTYMHTHTHTHVRVAE